MRGRTFFLFDTFSKVLLKLAVTISPIFSKLSSPSIPSFNNFKTPPKHSNKVSDVAFCTPNGHRIARHRCTTGVNEKRSGLGRMGRNDMKPTTMGTIGIRLSRGLSQVFRERDLALGTWVSVADIISASRVQYRKSSVGFDNLLWLIRRNRTEIFRAPTLSPCLSATLSTASQRWPPLCSERRRTHRPMLFGLCQFYEALPAEEDQKVLLMLWQMTGRIAWF